ncbi:MAG: dihydroneopterin aldolase [Bacteroidota bacterium]|nr:dihydroneopterin aldolase [Bacteroidota bacterium]
MGKILLQGMEFFAYHGCFREEQIIGTKFTVDLEIEYDTTATEKSDRLSDALNYQAVYQVVKKEMEKPSHLLEHVAGRILDEVKNAFPRIIHITVKIAKINPSLGGGKIHEVACILSH